MFMVLKRELQIIHLCSVVKKLISQDSQYEVNNTDGKLINFFNLVGSTHFLATDEVLRRITRSSTAVLFTALKKIDLHLLIFHDNINSNNVILPFN